MYGDMQVSSARAGRATSARTAAIGKSRMEREVERKVERKFMACPP
jgi:hypothetical protein